MKNNNEILESSTACTKNIRYEHTSRAIMNSISEGSHDKNELQEIIETCENKIKDIDLKKSREAALEILDSVNKIIKARFGEGEKETEHQLNKALDYVILTLRLPKN